MEFTNLIKSRHSCRKFSPQEVSQDLLNELIEQAKLAPSSRNKKPVQFYPLTDKSLLEKLSLAKKSGSDFVKNGAAAIVVACDSEKSDVWIEDGAIAMTYLHLAAENAGLGSCWVQLRNRTTSTGSASSRYVKELLKLEEKMEVLAILSLGNKA